MLTLVPKTPTYTGRILALNPEKAKKFQCFGFSLGPRNPYGIVPEKVSHETLHNALGNELLLDITDQMEDYRKNSSLIIQGNEITQTSLSDTDKRVFFVKGEDGSTTAVVPSNEEELRTLEEAEKNTSRLILPPGMDKPELYLIRRSDSTVAKN